MKRKYEERSFERNYMTRGSNVKNYGAAQGMRWPRTEERLRRGATMRAMAAGEAELLGPEPVEAARPSQHSRSTWRRLRAMSPGSNTTSRYLRLRSQRAIKGTAPC